MAALSAHRRVRHWAMTQHHSRTMSQCRPTPVCGYELTLQSRKRRLPSSRPMRLIVSDAARMPPRIAHEKALPFKQFVSEAETVEVMRAARRGEIRTARFVGNLLTRLSENDWVGFSVGQRLHLIRDSTVNSSPDIFQGTKDIPTHLHKLKFRTFGGIE